MSKILLSILLAVLCIFSMAKLLWHRKFRAAFLWLVILGLVFGGGYVLFHESIELLRWIRQAILN